MSCAEEFVIATGMLKTGSLPQAKFINLGEILLLCGMSVMEDEVRLARLYCNCLEKASEDRSTATGRATVCVVAVFDGEVAAAGPPPTKKVKVTLRIEVTVRMIALCHPFERSPTPRLATQL